MSDTETESVTSDEHAPGASGRLGLRVLRTPDSASEGALTLLKQDAVVVVGRRTATLALEDDELSRAHFQIRTSPKHFELCDPKSKNGTRVNGLLMRLCPLGEGDVIQAGQTLFAIEREGNEPQEYAQPTGRKSAKQWLKRLKNTRFDGLVIAEDATYFYTADSGLVDLSKRSVVRDILRLLLAGRLQAPGVPISTWTFIEHIWPSTELTHDPEAIPNRFYKSMSVLRRLGLGPWITHREDGYQIGATAAVWVPRLD